MNLNDILIKIIIFAIIILLGVIASRLITNLIKKTIKEFELVKIFKKAEIKYNPNKFLPSLSKYTIYLITGAIALNAIGITTIFLWIILIFLIALIMGYAFLSLRDIIPNLYYGIKIKKKYKVGDKIKYNNIQGKIIYMNLIEAQIQAKKEIIYIPYKLLK